MASQTFTLSPASTSDITTLCAISEQAFATDTHTLLKAASNPPDKTHSAEMESVFRSWMARPPGKCTVMKPIMPDGEVAGLVVWAFGGLSTCLRARMLLLLQLLTLPTKRKLKSRIKRGKRTEMKCRRENQKQRPRPKELGEITNASMQEWQTRLMPPGSCCMVLVAISVLREYQGQGIGSALIKWRTEITDSEGVYCWVSSSDKGWRAFQKMGFREVGRLSVDLDGFADEGLRNELREDGKWGTTIFVTCVGSSTFAYRHLKRGFGFRS